MGQEILIKRRNVNWNSLLVGERGRGWRLVSRSPSQSQWSNFTITWFYNIAVTKISQMMEVTGTSDGFTELL